VGHLAVQTDPLYRLSVQLYNPLHMEPIGAQAVRTHVLFHIPSYIHTGLAIRLQLSELPVTICDALFGVHALVHGCMHERSSVWSIGCPRRALTQ